MTGLLARPLLQLLVSWSCKSGFGTPTFQMEQHIRLIILKHLSDELDIHVLDVYFLAARLSTCNRRW